MNAGSKGKASTIDILRSLIKEIWTEKYQHEADVLKERPGSPGIFDVDVELAEHYDRIYTPRLERLKRMISELEDFRGDHEPGPEDLPIYVPEKEDPVGYIRSQEEKP